MIEIHRRRLAEIDEVFEELTILIDEYGDEYEYPVDGAGMSTLSTRVGQLRELFRAKFEEVFLIND